MRMISIIIVAAIGLASTFAIAEPLPLLSDVTGPELAEFRSKNQYFLHKRLYTAKRHRLVHVDVDALQSNEPIIISFFGNDSITLLPTDVEVRGDGAIIMWTGVVEEPEQSLSELISVTGSPGRAEALFDARFRLSIVAARYQHDTEFDANFPYYTENVQRHPGANSRNSIDDGPLFYGVTANIRLPQLGALYRLAPLPMGGAIHLLYEVDIDKIVTSGGPNTPENSVKREAMREFVESLGEDPRIEMMRLKQERRE